MDLHASLVDVACRALRSSSKYTEFFPTTRQSLHHT
jgi:hypothetical protein